MKIRQRKYRSGKVVWQLDAGVMMVDGKRQRQQKSYSTKGAAERALSKIEKARTTQGLEAFVMSTEDRVRFQSAEKRLRAAGLSLEEAVALAIRHGRRSREAVDLQTLWKRFKEDRDKRGRDPKWVQKLKVAIEGFTAGREMVPAHEVTRASVEAWIGSGGTDSGGWSPKTVRNYLGALSSMFVWAMREGFVAVNPCEGIELPRLIEKEPAALSVEQCEKLLVMALSARGEMWDRHDHVHREGFPFRPLLGYLAVGMFGGVRPEEIARSPRGVIDLEHRVIVVASHRAKPGRGNTRRRRVVELSENACEWLRSWEEACPGDWILPVNFENRWRELRKAAGCWPWPHDALRHTFASYHYAQFQNEARLKAQMGHSRGEDTLFAHYRAVMLPSGKMISPAMAARFWGLRPGAD